MKLHEWRIWNKEYRKRSVVCMIFVSLFLIPYSIFAYSFPRTLKLGMSGDDVKNLQIVLNSDPATLVASSGVGSKGQESTYFGVLTEKAVEKFQQKYAPEVLFPADIWQATGIVGSYTRAKLLNISIIPSDILTNTTQISMTVPSSVVAAVPQEPTLTSAQYDISRFFSSKPKLYSLSRYQAKPGDTITVTGNGFLAQDNTVFLGQTYKIEHISSSDGLNLTFTIPSTTPEGSYNVWIESKNGSTYDSTFGDYFTVSLHPSDPPTITSISPPTISFTSSDLVTISGHGFQKTENDIYTSLGNITNVSSNGSVITFSLSDLSQYATLVKNAKNIKGYKVPITVSLKNSAGVTRTPASFLIQF